MLKTLHSAVLPRRTRALARLFGSDATASSSILRPKRVYKTVDVAAEREPGGAESYRILLDQKVMKTQAGNDLKIESKPLALAIAQEWDAQGEYVNKAQMRITGLTFTTLDNPFNDSRASLTSKILDYLPSDTLLYFAEEPDRLVQLQHEKWAPVIRQVNSQHGLNLAATKGLDIPEVPKESEDALRRWLISHNHAALVGLQYATEALKSLLLTLATYAHQLDVEEAVRLARLEQIFQTDFWGKVEWAHDVEHQESCVRLSTGILFAQLSSNQHSANLGEAKDSMMKEQG